MDRWFQVGQVRPFARHREVWWIQRREDLDPGTTMAGIAADYAAVLRQVFGPPIDVVGPSTGGSITLQLAADHPDVLRRMALISAACTLGPAGREGQRSVASLFRATASGLPHGCLLLLPGMERTCEAIFLRRYCPDQVMGVAGQSLDVPTSQPFGSLARLAGHFKYARPSGCAPEPKRPV